MKAREKIFIRIYDIRLSGIINQDFMKHVKDQFLKKNQGF